MGDTKYEKEDVGDNLAAAVVVTAVPLSGIGVMAEENRGKDEFATEITDEFESETDFIIDEQIANGFYDEEAQEMDQDGFGSSDAIEFMMEMLSLFLLLKILDWLL